jgi:hypothetical protein
MRPTKLLQKQLDSSLGTVHRRRREAVWRGVDGVIVGGKLSLTALGRSLPGRTSDKHRIKAADRLLGGGVHSQIRLFYRALAKVLLKENKNPVVAVDWCQLNAGYYRLSAQLCCDGRTLPLYDRVYLRSKAGNPLVQREFLRSLATIVPLDARPIIVTDAGFRSPWFDAVMGLGWDFIGRIRNRTHVCSRHGWIPVKRLHELAGRHARDLGWLHMRRGMPREYRLVVSEIPKLKGRTRVTSKGTAGRNTQDRRRSSGAREPWLLATSLSTGAESIVRAYGLRMQIEQSFRDAKSHRNGWSLRHAQSKTTQRLEVLLLIAALAFVVVQMVGRAAAHCDLQKRFQANTATHRVLSFFVLGRYIMRRKLSLSRTTLSRALSETIAVTALNGILLV